MTQSTLELCERLSAFHRRVPEEALAPALDLLLNALASAMIGAEDPAVRAVALAQPGLKDHAGVRTPARLEPTDLYTAALLTGMAAHAGRSDDAGEKSLVDPAAVNLSALLGLGQDRGSTGTDFVSAFTLACEVELRLAHALKGAHLANGWDPNGTCGPLSAALGSALLVGLDAGGLANSAGIAASMTLGHGARAGTMSRAFVTGKAAANGLVAALLTESGFTGSRRILEAEKGFGAVLAGGIDVSDEPWRTFGDEWLVQRASMTWSTVGGPATPGGAPQGQVPSRRERSVQAGGQLRRAVENLRAAPGMDELVAAVSPGAISE